MFRHKQARTKSTQARTKSATGGSAEDGSAEGGGAETVADAEERHKCPRCTITYRDFTDLSRHIEEEHDEMLQ